MYCVSVDMRLLPQHPRLSSKKVPWHSEPDQRGLTTHVRVGVIICIRITISNIILFFIDWDAMCTVNLIPVVWNYAIHVIWACTVSRHDFTWYFSLWAGPAWSGMISLYSFDLHYCVEQGHRIAAVLLTGYTSWYCQHMLRWQARADCHWAALLHTLHGTLPWIIARSMIMTKKKNVISNTILGSSYSSPSGSLIESPACAMEAEDTERSITMSECTSAMCELGSVG